MLFIYRTLTILLFPLFVLIVYFRKIIGKEHSKRFIEKFFLSQDYDFKHNSDPLIWFHGASIGEVMSIFPIVHSIIEKNKNIKILITSVTVSSNKIIEKEFKNKKNIYHHYFPLDVNFLVNKFLDNWNPKVVCFIDSEIWPNFLYEIKKRNISLLLLNARITNKTFVKWKLVNKFSKKIFSLFDICLASSLNSFENLKKLGVVNLKYIGNLKYTSKYETKKKLKQELLTCLTQRTTWCAASTHDGEENICIDAHKKIQKIHQNILTIIIPRHIDRVKKIFDECSRNNLKAQILNDEEKIHDAVEILIINSFGKIPKFFDCCKTVFIGKSLVKKLKLVGGQNPIEAAKNGCKIYHGPYVYNFSEVYEYLNKNNIAEKIENSDELSKKIISNLNSSNSINLDKIKLINDRGNNILKETTRLLNNFI